MAKAEIGGEPKEDVGRGTAELDFIGAGESGAKSLRLVIGGIEPLLADSFDIGEQLPDILTTPLRHRPGRQGDTREGSDGRRRRRGGPTLPRGYLYHGTRLSRPPPTP